MRRATETSARLVMTTTTAILALTAGLAGCSSTGSFGRQAVTGPVGPSYVAGKGVQVFAATPTVMTDVKTAMGEVGIHSIRQVREPDNTDVFEGTTADNRRAQVAVQPRGSKVVVTTRIGWRGDEPLSRAVLDRLTILQGGSPATVASGPTLTPAPSAPPYEMPAADPDKEKPQVGGVPDSVMLRNQLESGYSQTPIP